ncbi:hypothetical protein GGR51DRAFT_566988 [Nemania sp. FL0031]|nr:hypothetical protein GGR51DRAFT_566988 [Nemania sp. FL0031]
MVSEPAYEFAIRLKTDLVPAFLIEVIDAVDLEELESSPWQGAFVKVLALPPGRDRILVSALRAINAITKRRPFSELSEYERALILANVRQMRTTLEEGMARLRQAWTTPLIYSHDTSAIRQLGFLEVGSTAGGDYMVDVPGCYHHLLLRERARVEGEDPRWRLVGLVRVGDATVPRMDVTEENGWS